MSDAIRVALGSGNSAKREAVRLALARFFTRFELSEGPAPSGVSEQPVGFDEIISGARNRARVSFAGGGCDLAVGIEDGLVPMPQLATGYVNLGCCVLYDGEHEAHGFSSGFEYPPACVNEAIGFERVPIGDAFDRLMRSHGGEVVPGPFAGNIGRLTRGVLTRAEYGSHAVICALVRFLHPDLYGEETRHP